MARLDGRGAPVDMRVDGNQGIRVNAQVSGPTRVKRTTNPQAADTRATFICDDGTVVRGAAAEKLIARKAQSVREGRTFTTFAMPDGRVSIQSVRAQGLDATAPAWSGPAPSAKPDPGERRFTRSDERALRALAAAGVTRDAAVKALASVKASEPERPAQTPTRTGRLVRPSPEETAACFAQANALRNAAARMAERASALATEAVAWSCDDDTECRAIGAELAAKAAVLERRAAELRAAAAKADYDATALRPSYD